MSAMADPVLLEIDARGVATATLNRPERGNAYDEDMLAAFNGGLDRLAGDAQVRALVLRGAGKHFQAGADIHWLGRAAQYPPDRAYAASHATTMALLSNIQHINALNGGNQLLDAVEDVLALNEEVFVAFTLFIKLFDRDHVNFAEIFNFLA